MCDKIAKMKNEILVSRDELSTFIPKNSANVVILGTMVSYCARRTGRKIPKGEDVFYYHDGRNRFWGTMTLLLEGRTKKLNIGNKVKFLETNGIAVANLVEEIKISTDDNRSSADKIIFKAFSEDNIKLKTIDQSFKDVLEKSNIFFTCKSKPKIVSLLETYFLQNNVNISTKDITFLTSPTRRSYAQIAKEWTDAGLLKALSKG